MTTKQIQAKLEGNWIKVCAHSITIKDANDKTRSVIRCEPIGSKTCQPHYKWEAAQKLSVAPGLRAFGSLGIYMYRIGVQQYILLLNTYNRTAEQMQSIEAVEKILEEATDVVPIRINECCFSPYERSAAYGGS